MVAVMIVVVVGSLNDYQKEHQFIKLNKTVSNPQCCGINRQLTLVLERRPRSESYSIRKVYGDFGIRYPGWRCVAYRTR